MGSNHVQAVLNSGYLVSFCYSFVCFVKKEGSLVPCAVKSLHDQSGLKERVEFLREAALMEGIRLNAVYPISYFGPVISNDAFPPKDYPCGEADREGHEVTGSQNANNQVSDTTS